MTRPGLLALALAGLLLMAAAVAMGADPSGVVGADPSAAPSSTLEPTPSLTPSALLESGDLRSEGEGPGLVGNPLLILGAVVLLGLATAAVTALIARVLHRD